MKADRRWWNDGRLERERAEESRRMLTVRTNTLVVSARDGGLSIEPIELVLQPQTSGVDWGT